MPRDSHYWEAISQDEELAEQWLDREDAGEDLGNDDPNVPLSQWSPERESLARVEELLQQVIAAIVAGNQGKPGRLQPAARPETAMQRGRERRRIMMNHSIMARLVPETPDRT